MRYTLSRDTIAHHCNLNAIQLHDFAAATLESINYITLHYNHHCNWDTILAPPSCFVSHSISRRVHFAGSRGPVKPAFCHFRRGKLVIPEQFTLKTHPVSVGWRRGVNNGAQLFQSTTDIDIQNAHKTRKNA